MLNSNWIDQIIFDDATPMMQQYLKIKKEHLDCLILFRMGDFYELFFEDAIIAAKILNIALAKKGKIKTITSEEEINMCGVPFHAIDVYLHKLTNEGFKIAICEQLETPEEAKKRGYKAVVQRDIVRIITPGTITEESILDASTPNYLSSVVQDKDNYAICYIDLSTASLYLTVTDEINILSELIRISPKEILMSEKMQKDIRNSNIFNNFRKVITYQVDSNFDPKKCQKRIEEIYKIHSITPIGLSSKLEISALGSILEYLILTQKSNFPSLPFPQIIKQNEYLKIDAATRLNLEIVKTLKGERKNSLLDIIDYTVSKPGSRLLYNYMSNPLCKIEDISLRHNMVEFFLNFYELTLKARKDLAQIPDVEKSLAKILNKRVMPFDLLNIKTAIYFSLEIKKLFLNISYPNFFDEIFIGLSSDQEIFDLIDQAISNEAPNNFSDGGVINPKFNYKLQELSDLIENSTDIVNQLANEYRNETAIENLKISYNNLIGFYIEVTLKNSAKINSEKFIHKQTLATSVRYITHELKEIENKILQAKNNILALEQQIFQEICDHVFKKIDKLYKMSQAISLIDVFCALAVCARENNYVKPVITEQPILIIDDGRHPVIEKNLNAEHKFFIANNTNLGLDIKNFNDQEELIWLITGPNMAGKSTFLRQNALIVILAQMGSYVPASNAVIGVVDKLFSRIGASDDLSKGLSTFMVEMVETATILAQATAKSLIILDEVGRGTSTYDGVAIAWAVLEYLHNKIQARTFFATHYHELVNLSFDLPRIANYTIKIHENDDKIIFTHKIIPGYADRSYGIHVAELAGLPKQVVNRARQILQKLEKVNNSKIKNNLSDSRQSSLF